MDARLMSAPAQRLSLRRNCREFALPAPPCLHLGVLNATLWNKPTYQNENRNKGPSNELGRNQKGQPQWVAVRQKNG